MAEHCELTTGGGERIMNEQGRFRNEARKKSENVKMSKGAINV